MPSNFQPFDLHRIFMGSAPPLFLLEIVFRTALIFIYAVFILRFIGKRGMRQMRPLDYFVVIALGSASGDPMFYPEVPVIYGWVVITTIVALEQALSWMKKRFQPLVDYLESSPTILIINGQLQNDNLVKEQLPQRSLEAALRQQGIKHLNEVQLAILEMSGTISVYKRKTKHIGRNIIPDINRPQR